MWNKDIAFLQRTTLLDSARILIITMIKILLVITSIIVIIVTKDVIKENAVNIKLNT